MAPVRLRSDCSDEASESYCGGRMLDYLIRGATVVDGTGAAARQGDVAVRGGRVAAVGPVGSVDDDVAVTLDAGGLVVAPGFVDPHTHYDAQLFWDPTANPSNVPGVTTVFGGNSGFTLVPIKNEEADSILRLMQKVVGMLLQPLENGVAWGWESFSGDSRA